MITTFITTDSVTYTKYHFENFISMWNFLSILDYPILNFHLLNKIDDGNIFFYDLYLRLRIIEYVSFNLCLRKSF